MEWIEQLEVRDVSREQVPDPFDRIIAATALLAGLPLLTADGRIRAGLGERAVWWVPVVSGLSRGNRWGNVRHGSRASSPSG